MLVPEMTQPMLVYGMTEKTEQLSSLCSVDIVIQPQPKAMPFLTKHAAKHHNKDSHVQDSDALL